MGGDATDDTFFRFALRFQEELHNGPPWAAGSLEEYIRFIKDDLLGTIYKIVETSDEIANSDNR